MSDKQHKIKSGIYQIKNLINGKIYIGSSNNMIKRFESHKYLLKNNKHFNQHLQNSWNKYGNNVFVFSVLEYVNNINKLIEREQYWINKTKCTNRNIGYNILSYIINSESNNKNIILSENTRNIMSENAKKRRHSKDSKIKIGKAQNIKIVRISLNGDYIDIWESIKLASKTLKLNKDVISKCCRGKCKTCGGYFWEYYDNYINNNCFYIKLDMKHKSKRNHTKLTINDIVKIKNLLREDIIKMKEIAKMYNVDYTTIRHIKTGRNWSDIII